MLVPRVVIGAPLRAGRAPPEPGGLQRCPLDECISRRPRVKPGVGIVESRGSVTPYACQKVQVGRRCDVGRDGLPDGHGGKGMPFRVLEVEGEDEYEAEGILRKARTGAGNTVVTMGHRKGPGQRGTGSERADERVLVWHGLV